MSSQYRTRDGDILDAVCWAYYGQQSEAVEAVLAANPGLAGAGLAYRAGVLIELPDLALAASAAPPRRLWD